MVSRPSFYRTTTMNCQHMLSPTITPWYDQPCPVLVVRGNKDSDNEDETIRVIITEEGKHSSNSARQNKILPPSPTGLYEFAETQHQDDEFSLSSFNKSVCSSTLTADEDATICSNKRSKPSRPERRAPRGHHRRTKNLALTSQDFDTLFDNMTVSPR